MARQTAFVAVVASILIGVSFAWNATPTTHAAPTTVHCGTEELQTAIDNAATGATLRVGGTCVGNFTIAHDLTLRGLRGATLQGNGGTVVTVSQDATVVLSNITVTGGKPNILLPVEVRAGGIYNAGALTFNTHVMGRASNLQHLRH